MVDIVELREALKRKMIKENKSAVRILRYSAAYFPDFISNRIYEHDDIYVEVILDEGQRSEIINSIISSSGRDINFNNERDVVLRLHVNFFYYPEKQNSLERASVAVPMICNINLLGMLLDRRTGKKGRNKNNIVYSTRYKTVPVFKNDLLYRLDLVNVNTDVGKFATNLDTLVYYLKTGRSLDVAALSNLDRTHLYRKHMLYLDYRFDNIGEESDAALAVATSTNDSIDYQLKNSYDELSEFIDSPDSKPWLEIEGVDSRIEQPVFKNVFPHQGKYMAKVSTFRGQVMVTTCYSAFNAAMYADAFIYEHCDEVREILGKLNFPKNKVPVRCICKSCAEKLGIVKKRGPQPKEDKLYFSDEYKEYKNG